MIKNTDLGHQTAQKIIHASNPLQAMQEINQNFPSVVGSLSRMKVHYCLDTYAFYISDYYFDCWDKANIV